MQSLIRLLASLWLGNSTRLAAEIAADLDCTDIEITATASLLEIPILFLSLVSELMARDFPAMVNSVIGTHVLCNISAVLFPLHHHYFRYVLSFMLFLPPRAARVSHSLARHLPFPQPAKPLVKNPSISIPRPVYPSLSNVSPAAEPFKKPSEVDSARAISAT